MSLNSIFNYIYMCMYAVIFLPLVFINILLNYYIYIQINNFKCKNLYNIYILNIK